MHSAERSSGAESGDFGWAAEALGRCREGILAGFEARLRERDSPLLSGSRMGEELRVQTRAIIGEVAALLQGEDVPASQERDLLSEVIGASRARERVHPSESLGAAAELTGSMLAVIAGELPPRVPPARVAEVAAIIQRSTMERVARASVSYVDQLLREVRLSHFEERRRVSRELHDRVANSLAVAHQNLQLHEGLEGESPSRAKEKLELVRSSVRDALGSARGLSAELRRSVVREGLEVALSNLLPAIVPEDVRGEVSARGDESLVPDHTRDEIFLILREGVRNAAAHSGARSIKVEFSVEPHEVRAAVTDDGRGFDAESEDSASGTGLQSMKERARLLGGSCRMVSRSTGTRVEVCVPLGTVG